MHDKMLLSEFFVQGSDRYASHVLLHISEPNDKKDLPKGYFFAVIEVNNGTVEQIQFLQQMIDELDQLYQHAEDSDDQTAFEQALGKVNQKSTTLFSSELIEVHSFVGVIEGQSLQFSSHGSPCAALLYQNENGKNKLMELVQPGDLAKGPKLFSSVTQGSLSVNDYLFVASPNTREYILSKQLTHILTTRKPSESAEYLHHALGKRKGANSYGGVIVHHTRRRVSQKKAKPQLTNRGSAMSLDSLAEHQQKTQDLLQPKPLAGIQSLMKEGFSFTIKKDPKRKKKKQDAELGSWADNLLLNTGRGLVGLIIFLFTSLRWIFIALWRVIFFLYLYISNRGGQRQVVVDHLIGILDDKRRAIQRMSLVSKILFVLTILSAVTFIGSISWVKAKEMQEQRVLAYEQSIADIEQMKVDAEARLIYNNEEEALTILQDATTKIAELPSKSEEEQAVIARLTADIDSVMVSLRKIDTVSPTTFALLDPNVGSFNSLVQIEDQLIAYGNDNRVAAVIDMDTASVSVLPHDSISPLLNADTPKEQDRTVFVTEQNTVAIYEEGTITQQDISFPTENQTLIDLSVYNRRVYALDQANNQIYRHNPTQTGYDKGRPWVKDAVDFNEAVAMAIDGTIYVALKDGSITQLDGGEQTDFTLSAIDPLLTNITDMWTYADINTIYVLDSEQRRFITYTKNGELKQQYTASEWQAPTAFVVDEKTDTVYLLDQNTLYTFDL